MTFIQLWDDALDIELATSSTELFTAARRKKAINDAQDNFARLTGCTKVYGSIAIVDGTAEYDLEVSFTNFIRLAGNPSIKIVKDSTGDTRYIQGKDDFPQRDPEELDHEEPGWLAADPGTPMRWYVREDGGATYLGANPAPDVASGYTWTWVVPYVADPADMSADADVPFTFSSNVIRRLIPYHQGLVHWAAAFLENARKNYTGEQRQMQKYSSYVAQYLQQRTEDQSNQITVLRDYFAEASRGRRPSDPRR